MSKKSRPSWSIPENQVTPETVYLKRRQFIQDSALFLGASVLSTSFWSRSAFGLLGYPAAANPKFSAKDVDRALTAEKLATSYNNYYEFSLDKDGVKPLAEKWKIPSPWKVDVLGGVEGNKTYDVEDLVKMSGGLEERIYRFRCVEAWSMVVPWTGFELAKLIAKLKPKSTTKYIKFTSLGDAKQLPNIGSTSAMFSWPYTEGLRLDEAMNPLAIMATGLYGKPLLGQNGAPFRLIVPWKYGFKSIKSIVKIEFVTEQPKTLWNQSAPHEYGFYANVNPEVDHPRWSQATERVLDGKLFATRIKTLKFNGYQNEVASLYNGMDLRKLY